ncbi:TIGR03087 family PEP-CTERM/XrtA system glycosyltransferase [Skermanella mucosa]|uniref:TIGR03087 family PEP-CTERM/XrtA system glycosyltransferase n=1 Tax=Skermanella mucosa TaxID=1789672 RepID=UPI00192B8620|nr:TIGR03087 family PEP-CTERM/XrtA system glycosyltransferase [Skermanella mucosa]UEM20090.1 TIGR03087 family PEP-CTERM/XrtA system glycosyltransferase [Skermanella mucosa]
MKDLLFLAHRIPYPPNKGDKIRSWHLLRHLAERYRVHLGCFVDDPEDRAHEPVLRALCASCHFARLDPALAKLGSLRGLATGEALTFAYFRDAGLTEWVSATHAARAVAVQFVFSSSMAPFAEAAEDFRGRRIVDFIDLDSDKWRQYALSGRAPMRWIHGREARLLGRAEVAIAARASAGLFVSEAEADLFRRQPGVAAERVHGLGNGVDLDYFDPSRDHADPYPPGGPVLVFTGMMDYRANVDAVRWFAAEVLPAIRAKHPEARFAIVGAKPDPAVRRLAGQPGVIVTGRVPDVRPYVAHAALAVAPLRIARGIQNKVLEAMAMGRPVVATPQAHEGIDAARDAHLLVGDDAAGLAAQACRLIENPSEAAALGARGRCLLADGYTWERRLAPLDGIIERAPAVSPASLDAPCSLDRSCEERA